MHCLGCNTHSRFLARKICSKTTTWFFWASGCRGGGSEREVRQKARHPVHTLGIVIMEVHHLLLKFLCRPLCTHLTPRRRQHIQKRHGGGRVLHFLGGATGLYGKIWWGGEEPTIVLCKGKFLALLLKAPKENFDPWENMKRLMSCGILLLIAHLTPQKLNNPFLKFGFQPIRRWGCLNLGFGVRQGGQRVAPFGPNSPQIEPLSSEGNWWHGFLREMNTLPYQPLRRKNDTNQRMSKELSTRVF